MLGGSLHQCTRGIDCALYCLNFVAWATTAERNRAPQQAGSRSHHITSQPTIKNKFHVTARARPKEVAGYFTDSCPMHKLLANKTANCPGSIQILTFCHRPPPIEGLAGLLACWHAGLSEYSLVMDLADNPSTNPSPIYITTSTSLPLSPPAHPPPVTNNLLTDPLTHRVKPLCSCA